MHFTWQVLFFLSFIFVAHLKLKYSIRMAFIPSCRFSLTTGVSVERMKRVLRQMFAFCKSSSLIIMSSDAVRRDSFCYQIKVTKIQWTGMEGNRQTVFWHLHRSYFSCIFNWCLFPFRSKHDTNIISNRTRRMKCNYLNSYLLFGWKLFKELFSVCEC